MEQTKMMSYRRWRNNFIKEGYSNIAMSAEESFRRLNIHSATIILEQNEKNTQPEVRLPMLNFRKKRKEYNERKLIQKLMKICKKESIFRKERVEKLKQLIKNNKYRIPGKAVVDKWFSERSAI